MTRDFKPDGAFDRMIRGHMEMKAGEELAELDEPGGRYAALADQLTQESGYLPPQGDQSWRELEALRIVPAYEKLGAGETANDDPMEQEQNPESDSPGRGLKGVMFVLLMVPVIAFAIVALTSPGILPAVFLHAHWGGARAAANSPAAPASAVHVPSPVPAPVAERAPPPRPLPAPTIRPSLNPAAVANAPAPVPAPPVEREPMRQSQSARATSPNLNTAPATNATPAAAPKPSHRPAMRAVKHDNRGTSGFYAMVAEPDGTLEYRYFSSKPSR